MGNTTSSVSELLNNTTVTTVNNKFKTTVTTVGTKYKEADILFEDLSDLVNQDFKKWYCKRFHELGHEKVLRLASQARSDGLQPRKLFSYLLRQA